VQSQALTPPGGMATVKFFGGNCQEILNAFLYFVSIDRRAAAAASSDPASVKSVENQKRI
jgi:hypothetical protein